MHQVACRCCGKPSRRAHAASANCRYLRRHKPTNSIASADVGSVSVSAGPSRARKSEASSRTRATAASQAPPSPSIASSVASVAPSTASKVGVHVGVAPRSTRKRGAAEKLADIERNVAALSALEPVTETAEHALSSVTTTSVRSVKKSKKSLASASQSEVHSSQQSEAPMSQQDTQPMAVPALLEPAAEAEVEPAAEPKVSSVKPRTARPSRLSRASEDRGSKLGGHATSAGTPVLSNLVHNMSPPMLAQASPLPSRAATPTTLPPAALPPAAADVPVQGVPAAAPHHHASVAKHKPKHDTTSAGARAMKNQLYSVLSDISARAGSEFSVFGMQSMRTADPDSRPLVARPKQKKSGHKRAPTLLGEYIHACVFLWRVLTCALHGFVELVRAHVDAQCHAWTCCVP